MGEQVTTVGDCNSTGTDSVLMHTRITSDPELVRRLDAAAR